MLVVIVDFSHIATTMSGSKDNINHVLKVKSNMDSGMFYGIQMSTEENMAYKLPYLFWYLVPTKFLGKSVVPLDSPPLISIDGNVDTNIVSTYFIQYSRKICEYFSFFGKLVYDDNAVQALQAREVFGIGVRMSL